MARIVNYFHLCPINDEEELFGLAPDHSKGTVINTLGKNIIIIVKVSTRPDVDLLIHIVWYLCVSVNSLLHLFISS